MRFSLHFDDLSADDVKALLAAVGVYSASAGSLSGSSPTAPTAPPAQAPTPTSVSSSPPYNPSMPLPAQPNGGSVTLQHVLEPMNLYGQRFGGPAAVKAIFDRFGYPANVMALSPNQLARMKWAFESGQPPDQINVQACPLPA